jgi:hypothetical protein
MINIPKYNKDNRKVQQEFKQLPKGNYVCKVMNVEETTYKSGKRGLKISFDIAEGEYKDFYTKQYQESTKEDKKWSYDAVYYLSIPFDGCESYIIDGWDTFWANIEDSNNGYIWNGDEKALVGKVFGGCFRIEQSEAPNGQIYDHTKLAGTRIAQDIRDGKVTWTPKDKLIEASAPASSDNGFMDIDPNAPIDLPFK